MEEVSNIKNQFSLKNNWAFLLAVIAAFFAAYISFDYALQPLLEQHSFRQTQTALTSFWMTQEGWKFAYETPVGGYPWKLPFEFPIYQAIVASVSSIFDLSLSATGRVISFLFLLLCALPAVAIGQKLSLKKQVAWVFAILLWTSPLYLFWGRTFMIETSVLFFTLMAVNYSLDFLKAEVTIKSVVLFIVFASLAMLQKVTTAAPVLLIMSFVILFQHLKTVGFKFPSTKKTILVICSFLIPLVLALLWVRFTDVIKSESAFGNSLTSKALSWWNYGTLEQRTDGETLKLLFWERVVKDNLAGFFGLAILIISLIVGGKNRKLILVCLLLFVLPILIFTNLHVVHNYYQTACACFLLAALAIGIAEILPKLIKKIPIAPFLILAFASYNLYAFNNGYFELTKKSFDPLKTRALILGNVIDKYAPENSGIVVFGNDWSSVIAFYSKRKSFIVPDWFKKYDSVRKYPSNFMGDRSLGAVVFIQDTKKMPDLLERADIKKDSSLYIIDPNCYVWFPELKAIPSLQNSEGVSTYINAFQKKEKE
ncbi:glycosyltransferase family 39 protein [Ulvibacter antarcticus]|uniref:4-amino-4-deoxy-L-arabinose transferase-like glycosyltransferase n=1 Tax=Ulvibacter antarcticus TaxID=442714 RepID=A0A3L9Z469_9FLAO|nr:glycosyltransferase family 39 protein [Ulvibacter antarcticus]RMA66229.1 4-amino-4-deoxy-L-arabinose transferase-like glycosyltransferase [Ulvibacter antarcticus]